MSRPRLSVPNQCWALSGRNRAARSDPYCKQAGLRITQSSAGSEGQVVGSSLRLENAIACVSQCVCSLKGVSVGAFGYAGSGEGQIATIGLFDVV